MIIKDIYKTNSTTDKEKLNEQMEELIDNIIKFRNLQIPDTEEAK